MKYSIRLFTGSYSVNPKNVRNPLSPLLPPVRGLLADQQDRQRRRQRLRQDREVRALDPPLEDARDPARGDGRRDQHDRQQRERGGGERLPLARAASPIPSICMKSGTAGADPASAILRCMPIM